jgi:hypothetical protein
MILALGKPQKLSHRMAFTLPGGQWVSSPFELIGEG